MNNHKILFFVILTASLTSFLLLNVAYAESQILESEDSTSKTNLESGSNVIASEKDDSVQLELTNSTINQTQSHLKNIPKFSSDVVLFSSTTNTNEGFEHGKVIWYGSSLGGSTDVALHLQNLGVDLDKRARPVSNLSGADVVFIGPFLRENVFSEVEETEIVNYVKNGGNLILAVDTDYFHCNPDSQCALEITKEYFGFGFDGDIQSGTLTPALGQSTHPIWNSPNSFSSFSSWCCDGYIMDILDPNNITVLARTSGFSFEIGQPIIFVEDGAAIIVNENPAFNGGKILAGGFNMILGLDDVRMIENVMHFMLDRDSDVISETSSGENRWNTRPTFGDSHETSQVQVVENGFSFNTEQFTVTDNHHTDFEEQTIDIGTLNSFSATVYADKKLKVQEFLFGIPNVGESHLAELGVEVWYDIDGNVDDVKVIQKSNVIDASTLVVNHAKTKCLSVDKEPRCDTTTISMKFLEPLKDKVMAIKAIDFEKRDQRTYLNDGFDISGESLNPMLTKMIPSNQRDKGLLKVTQLAKYSPFWISNDGKTFEMNSFGSFSEINHKFKRFQDSGEPRTRLHSGFGGIMEYEKNRALEVFDSSKFISKLPDSFGHHIEIHERMSDEMIQEMNLQEQKAKRILDNMDMQNRFY